MGSGLHPPEVADVAPMDGIGVVTEVVIGELPQPFQPGSDGGDAGKCGVEGGLLGVHRRLREVIEDTTMNALFNQEAKLFAIIFRHQKSGCTCATLIHYRTEIIRIGRHKS